MKAILGTALSTAFFTLFTGLASANLYSTDLYLNSDLDGDGQSEIARIVVDDPGGSGTFYYLLTIDTDDQGLRTDSALLGDRVQILSIDNDQGNIRLDMVQSGEGDAACCPTHKVMRTWKLDDGKLKELPVKPYGRLDIIDLSGGKWYLTRMDGQQVAADAGAYIAIDGTGKKLAGRSGCNNFTTTMEETGVGRLKIQAPMGATLMACPEPQMKLEKAFLERLPKVTGYRWQVNQLTLDWEADGKSGSLVFERRDD